MTSTIDSERRNDIYSFAEMVGQASNSIFSPLPLPLERRTRTTESEQSYTAKTLHFPRRRSSIVWRRNKNVGNDKNLRSSTWQVRIEESKPLFSSKVEHLAIFLCTKSSFGRYDSQESFPLEGRERRRRRGRDSRDETGLTWKKRQG